MQYNSRARKVSIPSFTGDRITALDDDDGTVRDVSRVTEPKDSEHVVIGDAPQPSHGEHHTILGLLSAFKRLSLGTVQSVQLPKGSLSTYIRVKM